MTNTGFPLQTLKEVRVSTKPPPETTIISEQSDTVQDDQQLDCQIPGDCLETQPTVQNEQENLPNGESSDTDVSANFK